MKCIVADHSGFCVGVKMAVTKSEEVLDEGKKLCSIGELIHNERAVSRLEEKGLIAADSLDDIKGEIDGVVIRAHGVEPKVYESLESMGHKIYDFTCPFVKRIHRIADKARGKSKQVIIFGAIGHPEIIGIMGHAGDNKKVFASYEDMINRQDEIKKDSVAVFQTTFKMEEFEKCRDFLKENYPETEIFSTVCDETRKRQEALRNLAKEVDFMVVIGGESSSNSKKLFDIAKQYTRAEFIQGAEQLKDIELSSYYKVAVAAGASTPDFVIDEVVKYIEGL